MLSFHNHFWTTDAGLQLDSKYNGSFDEEFYSGPPTHTFRMDAVCMASTSLIVSSNYSVTENWTNPLTTDHTSWRPLEWSSTLAWLLKVGPPGEYATSHLSLQSWLPANTLTVAAPWFTRLDSPPGVEITATQGTDAPTASLLIDSPNST